MTKAPQLYCGIDMAKASFDAALIYEDNIADLASIPVKHFKNNPEGLDLS